MISPRSLSKSQILLLWSMMTACSLAGCGYVVGSSFGPEVRTVHVPTFRNETFRRGFETQLTEAVHNEIKLHTPFQLVSNPHADTRLTGKIISIDKRPVNQNLEDDPRELELAIGIEVVWTDLRTGTILAQRTTPLGPQAQNALALASYAPETGQSLATATQTAVAQLAREIVTMLEAPW